jgi:hypothetical protein
MYLRGNKIKCSQGDSEALGLEISKVKEHKDETQSFSDLNASSRL